MHVDARHQAHVRTPPPTPHPTTAPSLSLTTAYSINQPPQPIDSAPYSPTQSQYSVFALWGVQWFCSMVDVLVGGGGDDGVQPMDVDPTPSQPDAYGHHSDPDEQAATPPPQQASTQQHTGLSHHVSYLLLNACIVFLGWPCVVNANTQGKVDPQMKQPAVRLLTCLVWMVVGWCGGCT